MKFLVLAAILFAFYRFMYKPNLLDQRKKNQSIENEPDARADEYTDYEEVD